MEGSSFPLKGPKQKNLRRQQRISKRKRTETSPVFVEVERSSKIVALVCSLVEKSHTRKVLLKYSYGGKIMDEKLFHVTISEAIGFYPVTDDDKTTIEINFLDGILEGMTVRAEIYKDCLKGKDDD